MRLIAASILFVPQLALAQSAPELGSSLLQLVLGFGLVLAMLFGCIWLLKRISVPRGASTRALNVISGVAVGPRERVVIVEVDDQWLVLGVAPGQVSKLHVMPRAIDSPPPHPLPVGQDFAAWLKRTLERRGAGGGN